MEVNKAGDAAMHEWVLLPVASSSRGVPEMALENLSPQAFASNTSTMICQKKGAFAALDLFPFHSNPLQLHAQAALP